MIFPKPISYYQHPDFIGDRGAPVLTDSSGFQPLILGADRAFIGRVTAQLGKVMFRRSGTLLGEYVFLARGGLAIDRNGMVIRANYDPEEDSAHFSVFNQIENMVLSDDFIRIRDQALEHWEELPTFSDLPIVSEWYAAANYYHFMVRFIPQIRAYPDAPTTAIGVPEDLMVHRFQRDLLAMTCGSRTVAALPFLFRARDPKLGYEPISAENFQWLRQQTGLRASPGDRRIYISRGASLVGRKGGNIVETEEFQDVLRRYGFETIAFGGGELSIAEQVALLDGAKIVLSAHGANLTNICFLEPGTSVVELFGQHWVYQSHMQIAMHTKLKYTGLICNTDENMNIVPDMALLSLALERALEAA